MNRFLASTLSASLIAATAMWIGGDHGSAAAETVEPARGMQASLPPAPLAGESMRSVAADLRAGERLTDLLRRKGVGSLDAALADRLATEAGELPAGARVTVHWAEAANGPATFDKITVRPRLGTTITVTRSGEMLTAQSRQTVVDTRPLRIRGRVGSDLAASLRAAGATAADIRHYLSALQSRVSLSDIGAEDRFDLLVQVRTTDAGEMENGPLLFAGLERAAGGSLQLVRWTEAGALHWVDASGVQADPAQSTMVQPVNARVTSGFGARIHPILRFLRVHRGIDYGAPAGTPVIAAKGGTVTAAGWAGGYGNQVRILHPGGLETSYSHLASINVEPGQSVGIGQRIGRVGSTGLSTGPHLHFELLRNGSAVDPLGTRMAARPVRAAVSASAARARLRDLLSLAFRERRA